MRGKLKRQINGVSAQADDALSLEQQKIANFFTGGSDVLSAANAPYVNVSIAALSVKLTDRIDKRINESHISSSTNKMFSDTSWRRSMSRQAKITSALMAYHGLS